MTENRAADREHTKRPPHTSRGSASTSRYRAQFIARYRRVRSMTERLMAPLAPDEFRIQSMDEVSPPYWNLGHTSWFFAHNALREFARLPRGTANDSFEGLDYALNSYYEGVGPRLPRGDRGRVATPSTALVRSYREAVDRAMVELIADCQEQDLERLAKIVTIGCQHEQQHQELFVTEIQHIRWSAPAPLRRGYVQAERCKTPAPKPCELQVVPFEATETVQGHRGHNVLTDGTPDDSSNSERAFCWDNELPAHPVHVHGFELANRLVTNAEWLAFIADGGYQNPLLWLSNGWQAVKDHNWRAPLYWQENGDHWQRFTHYGLHELDLNLPVCHVSFYEADAFARWFGEQHQAWRRARLPREAEWEHAARTDGFDTSAANLLDDDLNECSFDVTAAGTEQPETGRLLQMAGTAWEWTASHYEGYPGYRPYPGALTEYNGKFMDNQRILRGGSFATPRAQARATYRNFWDPTTRFQASSVRLLRDL